MIGKKKEAELLTLADVAAYGHVTISAIRDAIGRGKLKAFKNKQRVFVTREDYDDYRLHKFDPARKLWNGEQIFDITAGRFSVAQIAHIFSNDIGRFFSHRKIYKLLEVGELKGYRVDKFWVIYHLDAVNFIRKELAKDGQQLTFKKVVA